MASTPARLVPEPTVQRLFQANSANLAATSDILDIASALSGETRAKLLAAVKTVIGNSEVITSALSKAPSAG